MKKISIVLGIIFFFLVLKIGYALPSIVCDKDVYVALQKFDAFCNITNDLNYDITVHNYTLLFPINGVIFEPFVKKNVTYNIPIYEPCLQNFTVNGSWVYNETDGLYYFDGFALNCTNIYSINQTNDTCEYETQCYTEEERWRWDFVPLELPFNMNASETKEFLFKVSVPIGSSGKFNVTASIFYDNENITVSLDPWWDSAWQKRRNITVNNTLNSNTLTEYQVVINLTYDSDMQPDFSDIRFTWYNSIYENETEIPYWIESKVDSQWAYVWVKVPQIPANGYATIYVYYKNSTPVSSASNGNAVFILFEDCDDVSEWTFTLPTSLTSDSSVTYDGKTCKFTFASGGSRTAYKTFINPPKYYVYSKFRWADGHNGGLVYATTTDQNNAFVVVFRDYTNYLSYYDNGHHDFLPVTAINWYEVKTYLDGTSYAVVWAGLDDKNWNTYDVQQTITDQGTASNFGGLGFYSTGYDTTYYDNIFITKASYPDPEPTYSIGSEENYLTSCSVLYEEGATYYLVQDIIDAVETCMNITANNITLDCMGHIIDGVYEGCGIYVGNIQNIRIRNCEVTEWEYGICLDSGQNHIVYFNKIQSNTYGIKIGETSENIIYNNFFNNTNNFYFSYIYSNYWNTTKRVGSRIYSPGTEIGGNYWTNPSGNGYSDTCDDADRDGFCDDPYVLNENNIDYMPLSDEFYLWWDSSWQYRRSITIYSSSIRTFEPIEIFVDASSWEHKPYNDSIRITTADNIEIPSYVYNITQSNGIMSSFTLAFEGNLTSGNTTFYMYYDTTSKGDAGYSDPYLQYDSVNYRLQNRYIRIGLCGSNTLGGDCPDTTTYGGKIWLNFTEPSGTTQYFPNDYHYSHGIFANGDFALVVANTSLFSCNPVFCRVNAYWRANDRTNWQASYLNISVELWSHGKAIIFGKLYGRWENTNPNYKMFPYNDVDLPGGTWVSGAFENATGVFTSYDSTSKKKWIWENVNFVSPRQSIDICFVQPDWNTLYYRYGQFCSGHSDGYMLNGTPPSNVYNKAKFYYFFSIGDSYSDCQNFFNQVTSPLSFYVGSEESYIPVPIYLTVTFNYNSVNFGSLNHNTLSPAPNQESGIYNVSVEANSSYKVKAYGNNFEGPTPLSISNLYFDTAPSPSQLSFSNSVSLSTYPQVIDSNIPPSVTVHYHGYWLNIPYKQKKGNYYTTVYIIYSLE